jgi:acyl carrier protein
MDSVAILEVIASLEDRFGVRLLENLSDTTAIGTPKKIAELIDFELKKRGR